MLIAVVLFAAWQWGPHSPPLLVLAVVVLVLGVGLAILRRLAVCEAGVMLGASFYPWSQIRSC